MRPIAALRVSLLVACAAACGGGGSPLDVTRDTGAPIQTERLRYTFAAGSPARADIAIAFEFTNAGPDTLYFVGCYNGVLPVLQKKQGSAWVTARLIVPPPCFRLITIPPRTTRADTLPVCYPTSPTTSSCPPWQAEGVDGVYRLWAMGAYFHYDPVAGGRPVPDSLRISNEFVLELK